MKSPSALVVGLVAVVGRLASGQSLSDIPVCGRQAALAAYEQSGCLITDLECVCSKISLLDSLRSNILGECSQEDQQLALEFRKKLCAGRPGYPDVDEMSAAATTEPAAETTAPPEEMMSSMGEESSAYSMHREGDMASASGAMTTPIECGPVGAESTMDADSSASSEGSSATDMDESMSMTTAAESSQFTGDAASMGLAALANGRWFFLPACAVAAAMLAIGS